MVRACVAGQGVPPPAGRWTAHFARGAPCAECRWRLLRQEAEASRSMNNVPSCSFLVPVPRASMQQPSRTDWEQACWSDARSAAAGTATSSMPDLRLVKHSVAPNPQPACSSYRLLISGIQKFRSSRVCLELGHTRSRVPGTRLPAHAAILPPAPAHAAWHSHDQMNPQRHDMAGIAMHAARLGEDGVGCHDWFRRVSCRASPPACAPACPALCA